MSITPQGARTRFLPWRSTGIGYAATAMALIAGVPLFLSMPPWNDVTLYDMAVRAMLRGGVHYRDVFDTNLPGMSWAMAGVRVLFGWSYIALRSVDLLVIALEVVLLMGWVRRAGGTAYSAVWLAASAALFYPFSSEFNHVQRDPWLLLPALAAARLRLSRTTRPFLAAATGEGHQQTLSPFAFWQSVLEGMAWGLAVWVKPHVVVPAVLIWITSAFILTRRESRRHILLDLAGLLAGGLLVGAAGVAWLVGTGAWPYFLDVFLSWNTSYLDDMWGAAPDRAARTFYCFRPWSVLHYPAVALASLALWEARGWTRSPAVPQRRHIPSWLYAAADSESVAVARALLAALYIGWLLQAIFLQKGFDYVQVPLLFLAMAMVASHRWAFGFAYVIWCVLLSMILNLAVFAPLAQAIEPWLDKVRGYREPLIDLKVMTLWPKCWQDPGSAELWDKLAYYTDVHCGTNWEDLENVARYLKTLNPPLGPGELNCWHDSTHPLYLMLDLDPATRYMHYGTALGIRKKVGVIAAEVSASRQRYVVSDLMRMARTGDDPYAPGADGDSHRLPKWVPVSQRNAFPWNQPIVFRSGRYVVHKVEKPLGEIDIPDWYKLDELGPGEP